MFLIFLAFLVKITDISKMHSKRYIINNANNNNNNMNNNINNSNNNQSHNNGNTNNSNNNMSSHRQWQHVANNKKIQSNSSSTSSGCDSSASSSSKENNYQSNRQSPHYQQNVALTPQQMQQLRYCQQLQHQQLQLLQQQLIQRKRLQQQLKEQGVDIKKATSTTAAAKSKTLSAPTTKATTLTCNQQYLKQLRMQNQQQHHLYNGRELQQQQQQQYQRQYQPKPHVDNFMFQQKSCNINLNDILNNNNNNNTLLQHLNGGGGGVGSAVQLKGQKSCRGMTEFSTSNDINNKTHLSSQPLQNSPRHHYIPYPAHVPQSSATYASVTTTTTNNTTTTTSSSHAQFNKQFTQTLKQQQHQQQFIHNNTKNTNSSANAASSNNISGGGNILNDIRSATSSAASSATHSPTRNPYQQQNNYRNPFNSPNNSPFAYQTTSTTTGGSCAQQYQRRKLPFLTHTQYQQHLNDLLLQQQHLQQQQQQLLLSKDANATDEELSEESLKQNVAIVLNNLDRYNNALRSIILNEQVQTNSTASGVFYDESELIFLNCGNNNSLGQVATKTNNTMATAITPESDYNSNATTPGSRSNMLPYDASSGNLLPNQMQQPHQHLVGFSNQTGGGGGNGLNNACGVGGGNNFMGNNINCSLASSHDFTHDNSDYQWFLDYGYRDGCGGMQRSVLSSLSASYNGLGDLIYEDLAKNLDANLAEVDMESFRAEDIHSLLSHLPSYCKSLGGNRVQQSLMLQQHMCPQANMGGMQQLQQQMMAHNMSQCSTTSTNDLIDNSFCKSELLFSPVKESHISVDSLDMDGYPDDGDIILTCKANKDNYTIAFEGSVLYSDESFYEPNEIAMKNKQNFINLHSNLDDIVQRKSLEVSMSRSEQPQPCNMRNKLQKSHTTQLQSLYALLSSPARRYPSGNNNNAPDTIIITRPASQLSSVRKSSSLPNLRDDDCQEVMILSQTQIHPQQLEMVKQQHQLQQQQQQQLQQQQQPLNVSQAITTSHMETNLNAAKCRNLLPMCQIPITANSTAASIEEHLNIISQQQQHQQKHHHHKHRCCCGSGGSGGGVGVGTSMASNQGSATATSHHSNKAHISGSTSSGSSNPPAFNLVKLFIKQKSTNCSLEDQPSAHTCMDVSSGCWPSSDANNSSTSSSLEQRLRKKSMNDSGKGSALSRHDEEADTTASTFQMDASLSSMAKKHQQQRRSSLFYDDEPSSSSTGSLTATNSPAHRRRSMPLRNPAINQLAVHYSNNSNTSLLSSDNTSDQVTQLHLSSGNDEDSSSLSSAKAAERNKQRRSRDASRPVSHTSSSEMITRSMQTSCGSLSTRSSLSDRFRCVPPSFLEKLNNLGEEKQAPIYVIYPNYALPDLGFVKTSATPDVIFSPFNYKTCIGANVSPNSSCSSLKKRFSLMTGSDEDAIFKTMDYKHVHDWHSLVTLLPGEYRRRLKHIPEVNGLLSHLEGELSQKPLFCLTPPVRRNRPHICDCNQYFQQREQHSQSPVANGGNSSSSAGSSQQPSSGYRGSSTLLTDSEFEIGSEAKAAGNSGDNLKQMFVYQYEQQRMDSGVEMSPKVQSVAPVPMPRGILRKSSSGVRNKRNSMVEQDTKQAKLEKRRSLQEPPNNYPIGSAEELTDVYEEEAVDAYLYAVPQPRSERLSRKDLDARVRAENFLSSLPRHELKYYAEIASILESSEMIPYDAAALKKEVSRALSQQKKVSFNDKDDQEVAAASSAGMLMQMQPEARQRFTTPPNSPNISMAVGNAPPSAALRLQNTAAAANSKDITGRRCSQREDIEKQKLESNRFKRLQIQWELISKDSSMLKELASAEQTKSGGSTPTSAQAAANAAAQAASKSRIPRPVSYPAGKITNQSDPTKTTRSPSRIQPPKRYSMTTTPPSVNAAATAAAAALSSPSTPTAPGGVGSSRARTPNGRVAVTAPNTPKKRVQSPRTIPRVR